MVMRWKTENYVYVSATPGNVMIIVTNKNGAKFACKMLVAPLLAHFWPALPDIAFSGLVQHWAREKGKFWETLSKSNIFLGLSHENITSLTILSH